MHRSLIAGVLAGIVAAAIAQAAGEACKPVLTLTEARVTNVRPPAVGRLWFGVVSVEASRCAGDSGGQFEVIFSRVKENAPDATFRERFAWSPPFVKVAVDFSADEAVDRVWIDNVTGCRCRD